MQKIGTILGLVVALGAGYVAYMYMTRSTVAQGPPQQQIDVVGIRSALLVMGQAERQYFATHSTYATLEQLQREGLLTGGTEQRGYSFTAAADGARGFTITAAPADPAKAAWPTLVIDESLQVTQK
jgi:hypothetical protein